jgi:hypothetical protein
MIFISASDRLSSYKPNVDSANEDVPPLTEFFELVHVADVIQQMIQLYYDEEIVSLSYHTIGNLPPSPPPFFF